MKITLPLTPAVGLLSVFATTSALAQQPAFPGALGFGANATGGRSGTVYHVTNLNDSGPGSFRDAVSSSGRIIVFDVGGYINLSSAVSARSRLTIAGQTAPGGGIGIMGREVSFANQSNIIVRHVRFRQGTLDPDETKSAISLYFCTNAIFDHVSIEFGSWNNIDAVGCHNITFQNMINADPIYQQFGAHMERVGGNASWFYNLWANGHNRQPLSKINTVFLNNFLYNFQAGYTTHTSSKFKHDIVNNYFVCGPASGSGGNAFYQIDTNQSIYSTGNLRDTSLDGILNGSTINPYPGYQGTGTILNSPWAPAITTNTPTLATAAAVPYVISRAGAFPRDQVDAIVLGQALTLGNGPTGTVAGTAGPGGGLYTSESQTGLGNGGFGTLSSGPSAADGDQDGMPDYWELANGLDPANAADRNALTTNGYTRLEEYLHWLAEPHAIAQRWTNTPSSVTIDLWQYTLGYTNASPAYSVFAATNGTVTLLGDAHTAQFTPASNFAGMASFRFAVVATTGTMTDTVGIVVSPLAPPLDLTWVGDGISNQWDTGLSTNWTDGASARPFNFGDSVTFDDSTTNTAVSVVGSVAPSLIEVNTSQQYSFNGAGIVAGSAALIKDGGGTLTLNTANSFTGGLTLNAGNVRLTTTTAAGSGAIALNGGTLILNASGGPATYANPLTVAAPSAINSGEGNNNQAISGLLTGNENLTLNINGTFTVVNSMSGFGGTITLGAAGTFRFNNTANNNLGSANAVFDAGAGSAAFVNRNGGITIQLGALLGGSNTTLSGRSSGTGGAGSTYVIGAKAINTTFAGKIQDGGDTTSVVKAGSGVLTLGGNCTHTGPTTISNGTLILTGNIGVSPVVVLTGATFGGTGVAGTVTNRPGSFFSPGNSAGAVGTMTISNKLALNGANLVFDLSSSPAGLNDKATITSGGELYMTGVNTFYINPTESVLNTGTFTLIDGNALMSGSSVTMVLSNIPSGTRQGFSLQRQAFGSSPAFVKLVVTGNPVSITWTGGVNNVWDFNATTNWNNAGAPDTFYNFDAVTFNDSAAAGNVIITGAVAPRSLVVSNAALAYTLTSTNGGSITGTTSLQKLGSGTLTLNGPNSFTGGLVIHDGAVVLNDALAAGTGPITLNGGTLVNNATINNAIVVTAPSAIVSARSQINGEISGATTLNLNLSELFTVNGPMNNFTGTFALGNSTGTFRLNQTTGLAGSPLATFDLGTNTALLHYRGFSGGYTVSLGALAGGPNTRFFGAGSVGTNTTTYVIGGNHSNATFAGRIADGTATLALTAIEKVGTGAWTLTGTNNTFSAGMAIREGTVLANNIAGNCLGTGPVNVAPGATLGGNGFIGAPVSFEDGAILAPNGTLTFNNDLNLADGTVLQFRLGTNSDTVVVTGALTVGGFLNVTDAGGFGPGNYVLFAGNPSNDVEFNNLTVASAPTNFSYSISTNTPGSVVLVVETPLTPFQQWQVNYFGSTNNPAADANADPDGDGQNNLAEFSSGTNPTNSASALRIVSTARQGNDVVLTWLTAGGRTNIVQAVTAGGYSTNFADLSGPIIIAGSGDVTTNFTDTGGATNGPCRYYRVRLAP